jgi:hypothetical protein
MAITADVEIVAFYQLQVGVDPCFRALAGIIATPDHCFIASEAGFSPACGACAGVRSEKRTGCQDPESRNDPMLRRGISQCRLAVPKTGTGQGFERKRWPQ